MAAESIGLRLPELLRRTGDWRSIVAEVSKKTPEEGNRVSPKRDDSRKAQWSREEMESAEPYPLPELPEQGEAKPKLPEQGKAKPKLPEQGEAKPKLPEQGKAKPKLPEQGKA